MNDKHKRLLVTTPRGPSGTLDEASRFVFNYTTSVRPCEVSLGIPIGVQSYGGSVFPPLFAMNRPAGCLLERIHHRLGNN
ncbi:HipA N-terminal domain-containing protein [Cupriavidus sp. DF5525]|uniref:HipA N-terminal domain-containing protein n=1 Tax=Cupriavidus sp. DF5525 TaxID=3160989 RepID=UPI0032DE5C84